MLYRVPGLCISLSHKKVIYPSVLSTFLFAFYLVRPFKFRSHHSISKVGSNSRFRFGKKITSRLGAKTGPSALVWGNGVFKPPCTKLFPWTATRPGDKSHRKVSLISPSCARRVGIPRSNSWPWPLMGSKHTCKSGRIRAGDDNGFTVCISVIFRGFRVRFFPSRNVCNAFFIRACGKERSIDEYE